MRLNFCMAKFIFSSDLNGFKRNISQVYSNENLADTNYSQNASGDSTDRKKIKSDDLPDIDPVFIDDKELYQLLENCNFLVHQNDPTPGLNISDMDMRNCISINTSKTGSQSNFHHAVSGYSLLPNNKSDIESNDIHQNNSSSLINTYNTSNEFNIDFLYHPNLQSLQNPFEALDLNYSHLGNDYTNEDVNENLNDSDTAWQSINYEYQLSENSKSSQSHHITGTEQSNNVQQTLIPDLIQIADPFQISEKSCDLFFPESEFLNCIINIFEAAISHKKNNIFFNSIAKILHDKPDDLTVQKMMKTFYLIVVNKKLCAISEAIKTFKKLNSSDLLLNQSLEKELETFRRLNEEEFTISNLNEFIFQIVNYFVVLNDCNSTDVYQLDHLNLQQNKKSMSSRKEWSDFFKRRNPYVPYLVLENLCDPIYEFSVDFYLYYSKPYANLDVQFFTFMQLFITKNQTISFSYQKERLFCIFYEFIVLNFPMKAFALFFVNKLKSQNEVAEELESIDRLILFLYHLNKIKTNFPNLLKRNDIFDFLYKSVHSAVPKYNFKLLESYLNSVYKIDIVRSIEKNEIKSIKSNLILLLNQRLDFNKKGNLKIDQDLEEYRKKHYI
jgi:hypothetical protein